MAAAVTGMVAAATAGDPLLAYRLSPNFGLKFWNPFV
jgi:hypothetical protein